MVCETDQICVLNHAQSMKELIQNERIKNFAWGKLFKSSLVKDIPFEKDVLFEDVFGCIIFLLVLISMQWFISHCIFIDSDLTVL